MFVCAVVVEDEVQGDVPGKLGVQVPQELQELIMPVPRIALPDDTTLDDLKCGKQGGCAVAKVVVSVSATAAGFERQAGLRSIQGLYLTLLIHT